MTSTFRFLIACASLACLVCATARAQSDVNVSVDQGPNPWTSLKLNNDPKNFQFAVVTDRTGGHRPGVFEDAVRKLNLLQPEFVMSVGDLIEGYSRDEAAIDQMWDEFESFVAKLKMPFFYVPGNHDLSNEVQHRKWAQRFGRKYYHFVYRDVLFLCLNSEDPQRQMGPEQLAYVKKALAENKDVRWTLVFFHQPLWIYEQGGGNSPFGETKVTTGWSAVEELLMEGDRRFTVFAGHLHNYAKHVRNDRRFIVLASTGGASQLRGVPFGEFDHVSWVTMTDEGPVLANLLLSGIWDENVVTDQSRLRVRQLVSAARVVTPPIRGQQDATFAATTHQVKLINDANVPLTVSARFRSNRDVRPDPYAFDETVEPNSVKLIDVKLEPRRAVKTDDVAPLFADMTLSYDAPLTAAGGAGAGTESRDGDEARDGREPPKPNAAKLQLQRVLAVAVDRVLPTPRRTEPVVVDGRLGDWNGEFPHEVREPAQIRGNPSKWVHRKDGSFRFATAHDEQFLYVAVDVTDERVIPMSGADNFTQDGIEIRLDARPDPQRSQNRLDREIEDFVFLNICPPAEPGGEPYVFQKADAPPGTKVAAHVTRNGYNVEVAVPMKYLTDRSPGREFRLNVAMNDRDGPGDSRDGFAQLWWRPDWRTDESYDGSGTFRRE